MGKLLDALSPPSAYRARQTDIWDQITDRVAGALTEADLRDVEGWLLGQALNIPTQWEEHIIDLLEAKRDELAADSVGAILRDRFDF
jgi:hypothetical protein